MHRKSPGSASAAGPPAIVPPVSAVREVRSRAGGAGPRAKFRVAHRLSGAACRWRVPAMHAQTTSRPARRRRNPSSRRRRQAPCRPRGRRSCSTSSRAPRCRSTARAARRSRRSRCISGPDAELASSAPRPTACSRVTTTAAIHVYRLDRSTGAVQQGRPSAPAATARGRRAPTDAQVSADGSRVAFMLSAAPRGRTPTARARGVDLKDLASRRARLAEPRDGRGGRAGRRRHVRLLGRRPATSPSPRRRRCTPTEATAAATTVYLPRPSTSPSPLRLDHHAEQERDRHRRDREGAGDRLRPATSSRSSPMPARAPGRPRPGRRRLHLDRRRASGACNAS